MARPPNARNWKGENPSKPLTAEATPAAALTLLTAADNYVVDVATMPYAGCGRLFDAIVGPPRSDRYLGLMVAPGARHARGVISRQYVPVGSQAGHNSESWTNTGGTSGGDVVTTHNPFANVDPTIWGITPFFAFLTTGLALLSETGETVNDAPSASVDRQYELQTLGHPYVEPMKITWVAGFTVFVSGQIANLEDL